MFEYTFLAAIASVAVWAAVHDVKHKILPDHLNLLIAVTSVIYVCGSHPVLKIESLRMWSLVVLVHGALVVLPPYGLGGGDLKLIGALGITASCSFVVLEWLFLSYTFASLAGLFLRIRGNKQTLAFGPWLVTAWMVVFMGQ